MIQLKKVEHCLKKWKIINWNFFFLKAYVKMAVFDNYRKILVRDHVRVPNFWHTSRTWGHSKKTYIINIRNHTFYLVMFLIIFSKLALTEIEWKIANSAKINIEVSLKKTPHINAMNKFQKYTVWREYKALFFSHF